jgi:hypothetical protein
MMDFWTFYGIVLPAIIGILYIAMRYHEWYLARNIRQRREQRHPGE